MISLSALISHRNDADFQKKFDIVISNNLLDARYINSDYVKEVITKIEETKMQDYVRTKLQEKFPSLKLEIPKPIDLAVENERLQAELIELRSKYDALLVKMDGISAFLKQDK